MCELFPEIIEMKNEESLTALHIVVIENNVDALKILLEFNAKLEAMDSKGHTALHFAVGKSALLSYLILDSKKIQNFVTVLLNSQVVSVSKLQS